VNVLARAGEANAAALEHAVRAAVPGATEKDLRNSWAAHLTAAGAELPGYFAVHSGAGSYRRVSGTATDRALQDGDLVWMDAGAVMDGYWSDLTRIVAVGKPTPQAIADYAFSRRVVDELVAMARPGVATADLAAVALERFREAGLPANAISRFGHGIGRELTEPPSLAASDGAKLAPGMTVAVETGVSRWTGYFVLEDNLAVTEDGAQLLAPRAASDLPQGGDQ
jgi:Xaa-Pro aminopeptidase